MRVLGILATAVASTADPPASLYQDLKFDAPREFGPNSFGQNAEPPPPQTPFQICRQRTSETCLQPDPDSGTDSGLRCRLRERKGLDERSACYHHITAPVICGSTSTARCQPSEYCMAARDGTLREPWQALYRDYLVDSAEDYDSDSALDDAHRDKNSDCVMRACGEIQFGGSSTSPTSSSATSPAEELAHSKEVHAHRVSICSNAYRFVGGGAGSEQNNALVCEYNPSTLRCEERDRALRPFSLAADGEFPTSSTQSPDAAISEVFDVLDELAQYRGQISNHNTQLRQTKELLETAMDVLVKASLERRRAKQALVDHLQLARTELRMQAPGIQDMLSSLLKHELARMEADALFFRDGANLGANGDLGANGNGRDLSDADAREPENAATVVDADDGPEDPLERDFPDGARSAGPASRRGKQSTQRSQRTERTQQFQDQKDPKESLVGS